MAADVDAEFNAWFNQHQPIRRLIAASVVPVTVVQLMQQELKQAFTHGFARGVASEVARFPPTDPELGNVR
jgi:hypothetical protein